MPFYWVPWPANTNSLALVEKQKAGLVSENIIIMAILPLIQSTKSFVIMHLLIPSLLISFFPPFPLYNLYKMSGFKLSSAFTLWVQDIDKMNKQQYSSSLREVTTFSQIKQFWQLFQFLKPTSQLINCDMYLFKEGVKPMWEDINNVGGGCIKIKIQKKKSNKLWESTVFSTISPKNKFIDIMNGIRIKIRESFDQIEIWLNSGANEKDRLDGLKGFLKENTQITDDRVYNFFPFGKK